MPENLLINGRWRDGAAGDRFDVTDPATGETLATVADGTPADAVEAVEAAAAAQQAWATTAPRERGEILRACWQTLLDHQEELAQLVTREHGKPLADARGEIAYSAEFFRWNSEEAVRLHGTVGTMPSGAHRVLVHHPPIGVVVMVTPWNFPAAMIARKVAPALAAGNGVVVKPAAETPLTALRLAELIEAAGVPAGLVNMVPTTNPGDWFDAAVSHRAARMVSFTGSTNVGRMLLRTSADRVLKVAMELGGNAPFVVFDDADLDAAVAGAMVAKMRHSAEVCTAANRLYVQSGVAEEFAARMGAAMGALRVGNGLDESVECGPMIHDRAVASISGMVDGAVRQGAEVVVGGSAIDGPGSFYAPTVLAGVQPDADITRHEIFGPVAPVITFDDTETVIDLANDTEYGLAAYVYTADLARGLHVSERIQAGMVALNRGTLSDPAAPFGGMKQSGLGREGGSEGIYEFCETQMIATDW
jgi:succinate-semialdehyde dehydrogenase/glutarate-semialdehyde dehydrogenase